MIEEEAKRAEIVLEIVRELLKNSDRFVKITHLLEVPECSFKDELIREMYELIERADELSWKLGRL